MFEARPTDLELCSIDWMGPDQATKVAGFVTDLVRLPNLRDMTWQDVGYDDTDLGTPILDANEAKLALGCALRHQASSGTIGAVVEVKSES